MAAVVLVPIVAIVSRVERRSLLALPDPWAGSAWSAYALAALVSTSIKLWSAGDVVAASAGMVLLVAAAQMLRGEPARSASAGTEI